MLVCFKALSFEDILRVSLAYAAMNHPPTSLFTFIPSVDDEFIPDRQSELIRTGRYVKGMHQHLRFQARKNADDNRNADGIYIQEIVGYSTYYLRIPLSLLLIKSTKLGFLGYIECSPTGLYAVWRVGPLKADPFINFKTSRF
ncbi:uncharacterized protein LY89DRAFT_351570 [Mollisia scopiformis]|uniref:Uncharacterized protein n=1 Tax=Mollisia scopiformis TaxID=149040 RepID=A0A132B5N6_MOLSC|nr:uncharacterized protein LY89DRAFT_351570 [Mollisia scopiformis]KUJ07712.1 hypothetical protein LY89DRAFT_351570 [Mollisia scopiformis]